MPETLIFVGASVFVGLALWLILAGDREQDIEDETDEVRFTTSYPSKDED